MLPRNAMNDLQRPLEAALGFMSLGMHEDALEELETLSPELRSLDVVMEMRIEIYRGLGKWESARVIAESLAGKFPENPGWWLSWSFALRREQSVEAAQVVLLEASEIHPDVGMIAYNLACYACVLGDTDDACLLLKRAFLLDPTLKSTAIDDPDLKQIYGRKLPEP